MNVPDNAVPYILYQRTGYLQKNKVIKLFTYYGTLPYCYKASVKLKTFAFKNAIKKEYCNDMNAEYKTIKNALPKHASAILDIGSGLAGIHAFTLKKYAFTPRIHLIDKSRVDDRIHYYYESTGSFYANLPLAKHVLVMNGAVPERVTCQEATPNNTVESRERFDIVTSFISWGFHYPINTYANSVKEHLNDTATLIIDVRKGTNGKNEIKHAFGNARVIHETNTFERVLTRYSKS